MPSPKSSSGAVISRHAPSTIRYCQWSMWSSYLPCVSRARQAPSRPRPATCSRLPAPTRARPAPLQSPAGTDGRALVEDCEVDVLDAVEDLRIQREGGLDAGP